ncbi:hypothetical protein BB560_003788 [Smittium megazygosporum]|uniref:Uncharacterized protein n=1 Tax=Smittium megazygosporum TaxID=133381 RepID=A0A2T9ZB25_9FUNG|nr:hypothetical protein BB560_003788 [Smittium megazygosporum]
MLLSLEFNPKSSPKDSERKRNKCFSSTLLENQHLFSRSTKTSSSETINDSRNGDHIRSQERKVAGDKKQEIVTRSIALKRTRYEEEDITEYAIGIIINSKQTRKIHKTYDFVQTRLLQRCDKNNINNKKFSASEIINFLTWRGAKKRVESGYY